MPIYEHRCTACNHEWEDIFKQSDPVPDKCPECNAKNTIERLMSLCSNGRVELSGRDQVQKMWNEGKKIAKDASKKENLLANLVGESNYNKNQLAAKK